LNGDFPVLILLNILIALMICKRKSQLSLKGLREDFAILGDFLYRSRFLASRRASDTKVFLLFGKVFLTRSRFLQKLIVIKMREFSFEKEI